MMPITPGSGFIFIVCATGKSAEQMLELAWKGAPCPIEAR